ncbi:LysM peptidoglycan-binding domain-containing protein [Fodinibius sp.]|uniref:LysM peptidoglycan-binding domain-containing protein n=1 Tax=Fodinibius sp. TaxID=1872440 RepID=UPI002ACDB2BD|nr:LysM peptidoglycan-binding domain-containing protein [Fodinibius sp.]MDZ7659967.1 LysM peptidoglycan-binding domain-containing protein [Fodinibius sp.]
MKPYKILVLLFIVSLGITTLTLAQSKTHTVKQGETLFSIAQQYDIEVEQVREWNNLRGNELSIGQTLLVSPPSSDSAITHTVQRQETLFSISKQYNVSIAEIKSWNNLSSNNLQVGQELTIYPSETNSQEQQSLVVEKETQRNSYYTVKSGDSLYKIAQEHDMTVEELKSLNNLSSNTIRVGQQLTVRSKPAPPPSVADEDIKSSPQGKFMVHTIAEETKSLQDLLNKFRMDEQEFRALNPSIDRDRFQVGSEITVLAPPTRTYKNPYLTNSSLQDLGSTAVSQYSKSERGNPTTNGELYNPNDLTAAHSNISLGSVIYIENNDNNRGVYVRINDRHSGNGLKLSSAAWQTLNFSSNLPTVTIYQNQ